MDLSSLDPPLMGADLSQTFSAASRTCGHNDSMDLAKKPEWYHRPQVGCGPESGSPFRCRSSSSYGSLSTRLLPEQAPVHCRNMDQHLYRSRVQGSRWHQGCYGPSRTGSPVPESSGGDESDSDSDVIFLVSSTEEPLLCSRFIQDGVGPVASSVASPAASSVASPVASSVASPAASSLDDGPGCYRPLPLSSASPDSSYSDESSDSSVDVLLHRARPVVLLSELGAVYETRPDFAVDISSDDSDVIEVSLAPDKLRGAAPRSDEEEAPPTAVRRSSRIRRSASETPPFVRRTSRNRLERRAKNDAVGIYYESCESDDVVEGESRLSGSDDPAAQLRMLGGASRNRGDESGVHVETDRKLPQTASEPWREGSEPVSCGQNQQEEGGKAGTDQKRKGAAPERRRSKPSANRKPTARWRRKRRLQVGPSAGFCPREPEIKLRYAEVKEEKKRKAGGFCPFVHVDKTACVIVNFQEDQESVRSSPGRRRPVPHSVPGFVPNTSCFQLCRFSSDGECQAALLCCLCGQTANAMGLGDLHGPYRPSGPSGNQQNRWTDGAAGCNHSVVESPTRGDCSSLPKAPPECWIHEDCGIWAAGVFLVRGRLYGLEEAARLARETVCSVCQQTGAIMGCFLKSCSKGFHYRCAIQSGCVLNEDNFSVRCSEHKRKLWMSK